MQFLFSEASIFQKISRHHGLRSILILTIVNDCCATSETAVGMWPKRHDTSENASKMVNNRFRNRHCEKTHFS